MPGYTPSGPYTNGVTAFTATFPNAVETWLASMNDSHVSCDGNGQISMLKAALTTGTIKRIAKATGSATQTITHNWGEQADIVLPYYNGAFGTPPAHPIAVKSETANAFTVVADGGYSWSCLYIKF